jgi:hypothetical protein
MIGRMTTEKIYVLKKSLFVVVHWKYSAIAMWLEAHLCGEWEIERKEQCSSPAVDDHSSALAFGGFL